MAVQLTRRAFLQATGAAFTGAALSSLGVDLSRIALAAENLRIADAKETPTICCYCSVGCGAIVHSTGTQVIDVEGDPDHPFNEGSLCSKGQALFQVHDNDLRLDKVKYRAPGAKEWEEKDWDWALAEIAKRIKKTRDATFTAKDDNGITVNRTEAIAQLGGAAHDNEECYLMVKLARALGLVYVEHQARI